MKLPRFSVANLMVLVGIVALNVPFYLYLMEGDGYESDAFTGCFPMGVALEVGLFCLIRGRRSRSLPFWAGFEVFGAATAITWIYLGLYSADDSPVMGLWVRYLQSFYGTVERIFMIVGDQDFRGRMKEVILQDCQSAMFEFATFLPMLLVALIGGLLTSLIIRLRGRASLPTCR